MTSSRQMFPCSSVDDSPNGVWGYSKYFGDRSLVFQFFGFSDYFKDCFLIQFREWAAFAVRMAILIFGIVNVVGLCSNEKMIGIDASWVVTFVKNTHIIRNGTEADCPSSSMCLNASFVFFKSSVFSYYLSGPIPAGFSFLDSSPKTIKEGFGKLCWKWQWIAGSFFSHSKRIFYCVMLPMTRIMWGHFLFLPDMFFGGNSK